MAAAHVSPLPETTPPAVPPAVAPPATPPPVEAPPPPKPPPVDAPPPPKPPSVEAPPPPKPPPVDAPPPAKPPPVDAPPPAKPPPDAPPPAKPPPVDTPPPVDAPPPPKPPPCPPSGDAVQTALTQVSLAAHVEHCAPPDPHESRPEPSMHAPEALQQPLGHVAAEHEGAPPPPPWPPTHAPFTQAIDPAHDVQAAPTVPHALVVTPRWHAPLASQHPVGHVATEHVDALPPPEPAVTHRPPWALPSVARGKAEHRRSPQAVHDVPREPHSSSNTPREQRPSEQQPAQLDAPHAPLDPPPVASPPPAPAIPPPDENDVGCTHWPS